LLLQIPIVTSNTNYYFKYQLLLAIPIVALDAMSNDPPIRRRRRRRRTRTSTK
jgi:hypothetical protein